MTDNKPPTTDMPHQHTSTIMATVAHIVMQILRLFTWPIRTLLRLLIKGIAALPYIARASAWTQPLRDTLQHHLTAWQIAWEAAKREEPIAVPKGKELEFLPAVLEVQESPPSPVGRAVALTIGAVFAVALLWASVGKIDIIAVAQGKVIQSDRSKVIQPLEAGVIKAIFVRDGDRVKQGDALMELDTTASPDQERFQSEYHAAVIEVSRLHALLANKDRFDVPPGANPALVQAERARLHDQLTEYRALKVQAQAYKTLYESQYVARLKYLEVERARAEKANEYSAALSAAEIRARSLSKEITKANTRAGAQHLTAPIDGVVQQLAMHTVGGVVTPAQELMVIAPEDGQLEVEAILENKDIGFIYENQDAEVKIDAFPYTRYGTVEGKVTSLSRDAVQIDKVGLVYTAKVSLSRSTIHVDSKEIRLTPGMSVAVEIKTGKRRLIEYFLSPLLQAGHESIRER